MYILYMYHTTVLHTIYVAAWLEFVVGSITLCIAVILH